MNNCFHDIIAINVYIKVIMKKYGGVSMDQQFSKMFEYLLALRHLNYEPIKDVRNHERYFYLDELLTQTGCHLVKDEAHDTLVFEISRQQFYDDYPEVSPFIEKLSELTDFDYRSEESQPKEIEQIELILQEKAADLKYRLSKSTELISLTKWDQVILMLAESHVPTSIAYDRLDLFHESKWKETYQTYYNSWLAWATTQRQKRETQTFYNYLFHLMQDIKSDSHPVELMLGSGLLTYHDQSSIYYPILTTKLELMFDAEQGIARLVPIAKATSLELEMLSNAKVENGQDILNLRQVVKSDVHDLFDVKNHEHILKQFIHFMHPGGTYTTDINYQASEEPVVCARQVLFVRKTSDSLLKEDLRQTISYIEEGGKIPRTLQAIYNTDALTLTKEDLRGWDRLNEPLLFPLHANEEQKDIARRLANNLAVTVQGPPGTGKSHTIANLICHLLANGKRVLVTSEKDKALRVLMNKIPDSILPLCVSYLGGDRQSLQQIESSIRYISTGLSDYDGKVLEKEIAGLSHQLEMIRRQMQMTKRNIVRFMELDAKAQPYEDKLYQPYELAQLISDRYQQYCWFIDKVEMDEIMPLTNEEFVSLWDLKCQLPKDYEQLLQWELPDLTVVPRVSHYEKLLTERVNLVRDCQKVESNDYFYTRFISPTLLPSLIQKVEDTLIQIEQLERNELKAVFKQSLVSKEQYKKLESIYETIDSLLYQINECDMLLVDTTVQCAFLDHPKLMAYIQMVRDRVQSKSFLAPMMQSFNKEFKQFYETTRLNGHRLETSEDIKKLIVFTERETHIQRLKQVWHTQLNDVGLTQYDQMIDYSHLLKQLRFILHTTSSIFELNDIIKHQLTISLELGEHTLDELHLLYDRLKSAYYHHQLTAFDEAYEDAMITYHVELMKQATHPLAQQLYEALVEKDLTRYQTIYQELEHLQQTKESYEVFNQYLTKLNAVTPQFAQFIISRLARKEPIPGTFEDIFTYAKLNTFLIELNTWDVEALEEKLEYLEAEEKKLISELIHKMTWNQLIKQITPEQDRALQMWMYNLSRIGKGTGKQADALKKESRLQMEKCQDAIPVWIMPIKEAIETFKVDPDLFDVVIIDESSQCNILSLPILMRAKKAVIVGDEQQISPVVPGISDKQVKELYHRYLQQDLELQAFDLETSIYDIGMQVFSSKGRLMLKEHFRSVPEIISFSNGMFYHDEMIPLKLPMTPKEQKQPVVAVYVEKAKRDDRKINTKEAQLIVDHITQMVQDPAYKNHTMGVISLLGAEQARYIQKLLVEAIGEKEMLARQLICGDAYSFQGDERDIMFLSLVIAPNMRYNALNQKMYRQRFNVAASRAKVQMRLYHSVTKDELSPDDLRYELLSYFQKPKSSFYFETGTCKTKFERDVKDSLEALGYSVYPDVKIGKYEIDLVVQSDYQRLGLSCDGDMFYGVEKIEQELERQRVLKRCGWTFSRLRATDFYQHKEKALKPIIERLQSNGLQ